MNFTKFNAPKCCKKSMELKFVIPQGTNNTGFAGFYQCKKCGKCATDYWDDDEDD
jgi:hypothetical protein